MTAPDTVAKPNIILDRRAPSRHDSTFEAANALRAALPMLCHAKLVTLISVEEHSENRFPQTTASEYLSRHGVARHAHLKSEMQL